MGTWEQVFFSWNWLIWAVVAVSLAWLIHHYGLRGGKERDVAAEFEDLDEARKPETLDSERQEETSDRKIG